MDKEIEKLNEHDFNPDESMQVRDMDIGHLLKITDERLKSWVDRDMKEKNLTIAQIRVLVFIIKNGESASQKEIEKYLKVSHPTVVGLINRLEKNGYVTTHQDEHDRRNKIVCTTDGAADAWDEAVKGRERFEQKMYKGLSQEEIGELKRMLYIVYTNLSH